MSIKERFSVELQKCAFPLMCACVRDNYKCIWQLKGKDLCSNLYGLTRIGFKQLEILTGNCNFTSQAMNRSWSVDMGIIVSRSLHASMEVKMCFIRQDELWVKKIIFHQTMFSLLSEANSNGLIMGLQFLNYLNREALLLVLMLSPKQRKLSTTSLL